MTAHQLSRIRQNRPVKDAPGEAVTSMTTTTHRSTRRRSTAALATLATAATLTACGGSPDATPPTSARAATAITIPTPEPSGAGAAPSPSTGTSPATSGFDVLANMPSAAKQHTNAGAQAFARYYIEAFGRLLMTPAKDQLTKLHLSSCDECRANERVVGETLEDGVRWLDLYYRTLNVSEPDDGSNNPVDASHVTEVHVLALVSTSPVAVKRGTAPPSTRPQDGNVLIDYRLRWSGGQWQVADFRSSEVAPAQR